ncbi:MAG: EpsG family protein [Muribaculaceae bacterium]|nr:EpsG family protein [Muribaculaceae bacterium]
MWVYIFIFIIAIFIYLITYEKNEQSKLVLGIYITGLALFVGCADMLGGYDRYIYGEIFDQLALITQNDGNPLVSVGYRLYSTEWGFLWFNQLMGYFTLNRYIFIFTTTCIIYTLLFISIKRYCRCYPFAVIVFMGLWFFFTFTYLRQVMAATIGWLAIKYAIDRKPIKFFLIVFIAFTFHNSAIVLAPLYFVPAKKFDQVLVVFILIISLAVGMSNLLSGLVAESDAFIDAARVEQNVSSIEEGSFRVAYFIESILFTSLLMWKYNAFNESNRKEIVLLNMAFVFCAILLLFVRSENGGRISWHYMIGIIASVTHIATHPKYKSVGLIGAMIFMCFILYCRILTAWGDNGYLILYPYKTFFTNGVREGDLCHDIYEYDYNYDQDKFYK